MHKDQWQAVCRDLVYRRDRDRLMCAMVAPVEKRGAVISLLAMNSEIAAIPLKVGEPMLGRIRLQWWRDCVDSLYDGHAADHPVGLGLAAAIEGCGLSKSLFDEYFNGCGVEPVLPADLENHAGSTQGALHELISEVLGVAGLPPGRQPDVRAAARHSGVAWALSGLSGNAAAAGRHIALARGLRHKVPRSMQPVMLSVVLAEYRLGRGRRRPGVGRLFRFYRKVLTKKY